MDDDDEASAAPLPPLKNYAEAVARRRALFQRVRHGTDVSYAIEAVFTIPHSTQVHAMAAAPCSSHIYTGGSDGFIRRYATYPTLNGSGFDKPLFLNLSMKTGAQASATGSYQDTRQPVLVGYWENEEAGPWCTDLLPPAVAPADANPEADGEPSDSSFAARAAKVKWGPKTGSLGSQSIVHSLAIQQEELWGLSGTGSGTINMFTIRHDEGQIRHVFRAAEGDSGAGHRSRAAVSVLNLMADETSFFSGGWDGRILRWDLNIGTATRSFVGHGGQISSLAFRPTHSSAASGSTADDVDMDAGGVNNGQGESDADNDPETSPLSSASSSTGVAAALVKAVNGEADVNDKADADAIAANGDSDADADGEIDDDANFDASAPSNGHTNGIAAKEHTSKAVPVIGSDAAKDLPELSPDVFMSTSIDGQCMLWDMRAEGTSKGVVRRFDTSGKSSRWATSACWSSCGNEVYVGRRSGIVQVYDIRHSTPSSPTVDTLRMPAASGSVSALAMLPSGQHLVTASQDSLRLWDLRRARAGDRKTGGKPAYSIIPSHHTGSVSQLIIDPRAHFLLSASGNRGWEGSSSENVVIHQIKVIRTIRLGLMAANITYIDDVAVDRIEWSSAWTPYTDLNQTSGGVSRFKNTLHWCRAGVTEGARQCTATVSFTGTNIAAHGDFNSKQGKYWCFVLEGQGRVGEADFSQGYPWRWFDGGQMAQGRTQGSYMNKTRCAVRGLSSGRHRLVIGQDSVSSGEYGLTIDYFQINTSVPAGGAQIWDSDFASSTPQISWEYTLQLPGSGNDTSTSKFLLSPTSPPTQSAIPPSKDSSKAIGLGIGLGVGITALLAAAIAYWLWRRLARRQTTSSVESDEKSRSFAPSDFDGLTMRSVPMTFGYDKSYNAGMSPSHASAPELQQEGDHALIDSIHATFATPAPGMSTMRLDSPETFSARG
ncbi:Transcription factor spt8 [Microbotryomycetes sp. JL201]|nr:Transcription factor spt8 [Microbotryomycetes sp. JL201]